MLIPFIAYEDCRFVYPETLPHTGKIFVRFLEGTAFS